MTDDNRKYPLNHAQETTYKFCPICGAEVNGARFCKCCGSDLKAEAELVDVYAGPPVDIPDREVSVLYAGPEYFNKLAEKDKSDEMLKGVYAAPSPRKGLLSKIMGRNRK